MVKKELPKRLPPTAKEFCNLFDELDSTIHNLRLLLTDIVELESDRTKLLNIQILMADPKDKQRPGRKASSPATPATEPPATEPPATEPPATEPPEPTTSEPTKRKRRKKKAVSLESGPVEPEPGEAGPVEPEPGEAGPVEPEPGEAGPVEKLGTDL